MFAWEAYEKGSEAHLQADPTKLEVLAKEFKKRKEVSSTNVKDSILDRYGGQEHLEAPPKQLLMAQTVSASQCFFFLYLGYLGFDFYSLCFLYMPVMKNIFVTECFK